MTPLALCRAMFAWGGLFLCAYSAGERHDSTLLPAFGAGDACRHTHASETRPRQLEEALAVQPASNLAACWSMRSADGGSDPI